MVTLLPTIMNDAEERSHATLQIDRLIHRWFPQQPIRNLMSLRSCAIDKATRSLKSQTPTEIDAELGGELQQALELLPYGAVRNAAARTFTTKFKAILANYAAFHNVMTDSKASAYPKRLHTRPR